MKLTVSPTAALRLLGLKTFWLLSPTIMSCVTAETPAMRAERTATVGNNILTGLQLHRRTMNDRRCEDDWIQRREEDYILELVNDVANDVRE
jgi:hypothetical protein